MNDNYTTIEDYILEAAYAADRFEIAWEIHENFCGILNNLKTKLFHTLEKKIVSKDGAIKGYTVNSSLLTKYRYNPFFVYKQDWCNDNNSYGISTGTIFYGIEWDSYGIYMHIHRASKSEHMFTMHDKSIKYNKKVESELQDCISKLKFDFTDWCLAYKYFDKYRYYTKEMCTEIINDCSDIADYFYEQLSELILATENQVDAYNRYYKEKYPAKS